MEFLSYGEDDDASDSERKEESTEAEGGDELVLVPTNCRWTEVSSDDDSDGDDDQTNKPVKTVASKNKGLLPSAEDLFSTVVPKFAVKATKDILDEVVMPVPVQPVKDINKVADTNISKISGGANANRSDLPPTSNKSSSNASRIEKSIAGNVKRGSSAAAVAAPDKETAKDRVKRQRLSGQSGIGDEFKTWRSDEEMRLRQQFD